jgi:catechol 2,3-dioxygenase-like lactoylglutathione lyase family enzyme
MSPNSRVPVDDSASFQLLGLDHITIPSRSAEIAEAFYVGLLGAQVVNRIDRTLLRRIGWSDADIAGFVARDLPVGVPDRSQLDYQWKHGGPTARGS